MVRVSTWIAIICCFALVGSLGQSILKYEENDSMAKVPQSSPFMTSQMLQQANGVWEDELGYFEDGLIDEAVELPPMFFDDPARGSDTPTSSVQLKRVEEHVEKAEYPVYRLFYPGSRAYITEMGLANEVVALERNPFTYKIEWEWIPQPDHEAALLRNRKTRNYLCFNELGKPTVRKYPDLNRCLLRGELPHRDLLKPHRPPPRRPPFDQESPKLMSQHFNNERHQMEEVLSANDALGNPLNASFQKARSGGIRGDSLPQFPVPAPIHLAARYEENPTWYIGFCKNGHAYTNLLPERRMCPKKRLSDKWNLLYICTPVPSYCRIPACLPNSLERRRGMVCPHSCKAKIDCGSSDKIDGVLE